MTRFFISGIWPVTKGKHTYIGYVLLQMEKDGKLNKPQRRSKNEVISLIKKNFSVVTKEWDYKNAVWREGAEVSFEKIEKDEFLRTRKDGFLFDNLQHLLPMIDVTPFTPPMN